MLKLEKKNREEIKLVEGEGQTGQFLPKPIFLPNLRRKQNTLKWWILEEHVWTPPKSPLKPIKGIIQNHPSILKITQTKQGLKS